MSLRMCKECRHYTSPRWEANPVGDTALPADRVTSKTQVGGACAISGEAVQANGLGCDSFRET